MLISVSGGCTKDASTGKTTIASENTTLKSKETTTMPEETSVTSSQTDAELSKIATAKVGDIVQFGSYEQDNNTADGKEKIDWRVLAVENGKALLLSEKILDSKPYNETETNVTWETCTLRAWLNKDFYNAAFSSTEQAKIKTSTVVNEDDPLNGADGGNNTSDKLFLLSYSEVTNPAYGFSTQVDSDTARQAQGTGFAKSSGLYVYTGSSDNGNSDWWLRTPGYSSYYACIVYSSGDVGGGGDGGRLVGGFLGPAG